MRLSWTREELNTLIPKIKKEIQELEAQDEDLRPLPPMTTEECIGFFYRFVDIGMTRLLTENDRTMMGQFLVVFQHAIKAEMLGKKGRYIVLSESEINESIAKAKSMSR